MPSTTVQTATGDRTREVKATRGGEGQATSQPTKDDSFMLVDMKAARELLTGFGEVVVEALAQRVQGEMRPAAAAPKAKGAAPVVEPEEKPLTAQEALSLRSRRRRTAQRRRRENEALVKQVEALKRENVRLRQMANG